MKNLHRIYLLIILISVCCILPGWGRTATILPMGLSDLADGSDLVIVGLTESLTCDEDPLKNMIYTYVLIKVTEKIKGQGPARIWVGIPGGSIGERAVHVPGMPSTVPGEQAVWFLESTGQLREGSPVYRSLGAYQGHTPVIKDTKTGQKTVRMRAKASGPGGQTEIKQIKVRLSDLKLVIKAREENKNKKGQGTRP